MKWENVYIFISSTFNDMHAERDYLVKNVFPALSEWCEKRKLRLIDIDLRWGVTTADSEAKNTVMACLRNIDECRPFFLCFLGQRRGWVPSDDDINFDTYKSFPKLLEEKYKHTSVTELEILHALIDPLHNGTFKDRKNNDRKGNPVEYAFFFLRNKEYLENLPHKDLSLIYTNEAEKDKKTANKKLDDWREVEIPKRKCPYRYSAKWRLEESTPEIALTYEALTTAPKNSIVWEQAYNKWKERWKIAGVDVDESGIIKEGTEQRRQAEAYNKKFTQGRLGDFSVDDKMLSDIIIEQLKEAIAERYKKHMTFAEQTPLQKELDQQEQFLRIASEGFIERTGDFDALNEYINNNETRLFALTAFAGMGKTSLLAHFIDKYEPKNKEALYYRFVGSSDDSVTVERLLRSILEQMKEDGKIKSIIPANYTDMMNELPDLLTEAGKNGKIILVIDALNQLETGMNDLYWLPTALPENIKLIVSFKLGEESTDKYYNAQKEGGNVIFHSVKPFIEDDRKALVTVYLEQYLKELDEDRIEHLVTSKGAYNPLYIKIVLSELRVFGVHNDLSKVIRERFKGTPKSAFNAVLERIENDPAYSKFKPAIALPNIFGWIAHSRYGMSVEELVDLTIKENWTDNKTEAFDLIYLILRQLRPYLAKRNGRVDFFYESFKTAVIERYTNNHIYSRTSVEWHRSLAEYIETLPMDNQSKLSQLVYQYYHASLGDKLSALLFDYSYIKSKIEVFNVYDLLEDFDYAFDRRIMINEEDLKSLKLIRESLNLSLGDLIHDKSQLAFQLYGRMAENLNDKAKQFFDSIAEKNVQPFLRPIFSCLPTPGAMICTLRGHTSSRIHEIRSCENVGIIASASENEVILWTADKMKMLYLLPGNAWRISLSKDGNLIAILRKNGSVEVWNIKGRFQVACFTKKNAIALDISADGRYLAIIDTQKQIHLCDIASGKNDIFQEGMVGMQEAEDIISRIDDRSSMNHYDLFFVNNGKQLMSYAGEEVILWDIQTRRSLSRTGADLYVGRLAVAEEVGKAYISGMGTIYEWDYANNLSIRKCNIDLGVVSAISVTSDGNTGVCINDYLEVAVVDLKLEKITRILPRTTHYYQAIAISESGNMVITGEGENWGDNATITLWNPHGIVHLGKTQKSELSSEWVAFTMSESGESIAAYSQFSDNIIVLDVNEEEILEIPRNGNVTCLAMNETQGMLVAGCKNGVVTIWKNGDSKTFQSHSEKIVSIDIHPDGHSVATVSENGQFDIVDVQTGMPRYCEKLFDAPVLDAKFTGESGEYITAFDATGTVKSVFLRDLTTVSCHQYQLNSSGKSLRFVSMRQDGLALAFSKLLYGTLEIIQIKGTSPLSPVFFNGTIGMHVPTGRVITNDFKLAIGERVINGDKTMKELKEKGLTLIHYVAVVEVSSDLPLFVLSPSENASRIWHYAISEDGSLAVSVDDENVVTVWDVEKQVNIAHFVWNAGITFITCSSKTKTVLAFDANANLIAAKIQLYDRL
jgi:WD40 repeat protein